MIRIGCIAELWRYPVKSMRGERLTEAVLDARGMAGDRRFAMVSTAAPRGKPLLSGSERTMMLRYTPSLDPVAEVRTPKGRVLPLPSAALLAELQTHTAAEGAQLSTLASPQTPLTDVRPLSLVSQATLHGLAAELGRAVDPQRFRSNLVLELENSQPFAEDALTGTTLFFQEQSSHEGSNSPALQILERIPRCRVVSLDPQTQALDPELLPHLARRHGGRLGIYARVLRPGPLRVGDPVFKA